MRIGGSTILLGFLACIAGAQVNMPSAPGSFPKQQPKVHIIWSGEVGRLESRDSHAVVTALILEDLNQQPKRMREVRIDLSSAGKHSSIYLDESLLRPEKKIFDNLTRDIERFERSSLYSAAGWAFIGSCEFREHPDVYPLVADYNYSGTQAPALRIIGPTGEQIMFQGLMPRNLSKVLGDAIEELKAQ